MKKYLLITAGNLSLSLGIAGIFLPVLPTTPFLLLSAACYVRSSRRLYDWLIHHRILGLYIRSYIEYRAISVRAKAVSIGTLWAVILSTTLFFVSTLLLRLLLLAVALGVTTYLLKIRTLTDEMKDTITLQGETGEGSHRKTQ